MKELVSRLSIREVSRDMDQPKHWRLAWLLRIRIYDGNAEKPKIRFSLPLPVMFGCSIALDVFACVVLHAASIVLPFAYKKREKPTFMKTMPLLRGLSRGFFLTKLSFALMYHGNRLGIRAIDGNSGVVIYGA